MSVEDLTTQVKTQTSSGVTVPDDNKTSRTLTINSVSGLTDTLSISTQEVKSTLQSETRLRLNTGIEATNIAGGAVEELSRFVDGIGGILEQANSTDLPPQKVAILEREAQSLQKEINRVANTATSTGVKPLAGDPIRIELEATLGKALEILLPDASSDSLGLGNIGLSPKDVILETIIKVETAKRRIQDLRAQLAVGESALRSTVTAVDVASQNFEASQTNVRDVDDALGLARGTKSDIKDDPSIAISVVGDISRRATELLR